MSEYVAIAEAFFKTTFRKATASEYYSTDGCPKCGHGGKADTDRFRLMLNGKSGPRVWCRQCNFMAFLDSLEGVEIDMAEVRLRNIERRQEELERRLDALEQMHKSRDHLIYHQNLLNNPERLNYWLREGIRTPTIERYQLGYCPSCPTAPFSPSHTIPVMYNGSLYNIRHRLIEPNGSGKYRPHMTGLPTMLFNADYLTEKSSFGLLLEGEKKAMVVTQETGLPNTAIMGMAAFQNGWVSKFDNWGKVIVALDPDAEGRAVQIGEMFGKRALIASLPVKADDFFVLGGGRDDFVRYLSMARPA